MSASFLSIDKNRLDDEWLEQPNLYYVHSRKLANARRVLDNETTAADVVWAELDSKIRRDPEKYGFDGKPTEGAISAKIQRMKAWKKADSLRASAKYNVDICQAAVSALEHRKRALTELVELQLSGYYSEPKARSENAKHFLEGKKQKRLAERTVGRLKED